MSNEQKQQANPDHYDALEAIRSNESLPPKVRGYAIDFLDAMYALEQPPVGEPPASATEWDTWHRMVAVFQETVRCFEEAGR